jgi:hypothetical protein
MTVMSESLAVRNSQLVESALIVVVAAAAKVVPVLGPAARQSKA